MRGGRPREKGGQRGCHALQKSEKLACGQCSDTLAHVDRSGGAVRFGKVGRAADAALQLVQQRGNDLRRPSV
jgi:hypothetical protein